MKFNPTPNQLVLIALCFLAVIFSNIYAPGAFSAITSVVSVLVGFLSGGTTKPKEDGEEAGQ